LIVVHLGKFTFAKLVQFLNTSCSNNLASGKSISVNEVQFLKAFKLTVSTKGSDIDYRLTQFSNA
jgi:hypothetical protein